MRKATKRAAPVANVLRVRMYRVGFGDFFLLTVPSPDGPQHILIDCGVHAANIGSMPDCIADLCDVTQRKLALVVVTHNHADHLSGFATHDDVFSTFDVGAVWITNRLDPADGEVVRQRHRIAAIASDLALQFQLRLRLGLDEDAADVARQALAKVENALGTGFGVAGGVNAKALDVVTRQFRNAPPVFYYEAGDAPALPDGAARRDRCRDTRSMSESTCGRVRRERRQARAILRGRRAKTVRPAANVPSVRTSMAGNGERLLVGAFRPWRTPAEMEKALRRSATRCRGRGSRADRQHAQQPEPRDPLHLHSRKLLFVGDAQWGNWAYWLYGKTVRGKPPGISEARTRNPRVDRLLQGRSPRQHECDADPRRRRAANELRGDVLDGDRLSGRSPDLRQRRRKDRGAADRTDGRAGDSHAPQARAQRLDRRGRGAGEPGGEGGARATAGALRAGDNYIDYTFPD